MHELIQRRAIDQLVTPDALAPSAAVVLASSVGRILRLTKPAGFPAQTRWTAAQPTTDAAKAGPSIQLHLQNCSLFCAHVRVVFSHPDTLPS